MFVAWLPIRTLYRKTTRAWKQSFVFSHNLDPQTFGFSTKKLWKIESARGSSFSKSLFISIPFPLITQTSRTSLPGYPRTLHHRSKSEIPSSAMSHTDPGGHHGIRHKVAFFMAIPLGIPQNAYELWAITRCQPVMMVPDGPQSYRRYQKPSTIFTLMWRGLIGTPRPCWLLHSFQA